jgi:putative SOS response-associated peptidase YedK
MRWGLVPWWSKKTLKEMPASFNARAETVADKPMFRDVAGVEAGQQDRHWR